MILLTNIEQRKIKCSVRRVPITCSNIKQDWLRLAPKSFPLAQTVTACKRCTGISFYPNPGCSSKKEQTNFFHSSTISCISALYVSTLPHHVNHHVSRYSAGQGVAMFNLFVYWSILYTFHPLPCRKKRRGAFAFVCRRLAYFHGRTKNHPWDTEGLNAGEQVIQTKHPTMIAYSEGKGTLTLTLPASFSE